MSSNYDEIFTIIHYIEGAFGIILNSLLIYLAIFVHTPSIREYRILLANIAISDLISATAIVFVQPRVICVEWIYAYIALGPSKYLGADVSYIIVGIIFNMLFYFFISFPLSFGFRYYILVRPMPSIRTLVALCCGLYTIAFVQFVLIIISRTPSAIIRNELHQEIPSYNLTGEVLFGSILTTHPLGIVNSLVIFVPMLPIYALVFYVRHKVHEFIDDDTRHNFSEMVKRGHKRLMLALTIHAVMPALFVYLPFGLILCYHMNIIRFQLIEYLTFTIFAIMPIMRPIVNFIFVRPYTKVLSHILCGNFCVYKLKIQDISHYTSAPIEK